MTPFHVVFGEHGPTALLGAIAVAAVLTLIAAGLEIALERAGGPDPAAPPDWFARHGPALFVLAGVPALGIATLGTIALSLALGGNPDRSNLPILWPLLLDLVVLVGVDTTAAGSPLGQHWGLGVAVFGVSAAAVFPLLFVINTLTFNENGGIPYPDRIVFSITVGLILLTVMIAMSALLALGITSLRTYWRLRAVRGEPEPPRMRVVGRQRG
jgi:hypothetical protein